MYVYEFDCRGDLSRHVPIRCVVSCRESCKPAPLKLLRAISKIKNLPHSTRTACSLSRHTFHQSVSFFLFLVFAPFSWLSICVSLYLFASSALLCSACACVRASVGLYTQARLHVNKCCAVGVSQARGRCSRRMASVSFLLHSLLSNPAAGGITEFI